MERLFDVVQDRRGNALSSATVTVRDTGGSLATIFSDDGITTASNPLTTNSDGEYTFFAANGQYSTEIVATGYATEIITQRTLFDPTDQTARAIADYGFVPITEVTTAAYTLSTANFGCWLDFNTSATAVCSLPDQTAVVAFSASKGASVIMRQKGAGKLVLATSGSATAVNASSLKTRARYSVIAAQSVGTSMWTVFGDME
jgi:hypothetical protein